VQGTSDKKWVLMPDLHFDQNRSKLKGGTKGESADSDQNRSNTTRKCAVDLKLEEEAEELRQRSVATRLFG
jgi:hypothetical protein